MATKTEERLKTLLDEYLEIKQMKQEKVVMEHVYSIFWWGVIFGTLISYMSILPIFFGGVLGYIISKKQWMIMDLWMDRWWPWIQVGQNYWMEFWNKKPKDN